LVPLSLVLVAEDASGKIVGVLEVLPPASAIVGMREMGYPPVLAMMLTVTVGKVRRSHHAYAALLHPHGAPMSRRSHSGSPRATLQRKRLSTVAGLTVGMLILGSTAALAAFPTIPDTKFKIASVGNKGTCLTLAGDIDPTTRQVALRPCTLTGTDVSREWNRDPSSSIVRSVEDPRYCIGATHGGYGGIVLAARRGSEANCIKVKEDGTQIVATTSAMDQPLYWRATPPGNIATVMRLKSDPSEPLQQWAIIPVPA
jgi:hypothetical protein